MRARILGTGSFVPERVVTNADLAQWIDTSDEWIRERTGIRERRWVAEGSGVGSAELGTEAARRALAESGVAPDAIELVIFATLSPNHDFPGNGVLLQRSMGLTSAATLDIRQQCTGFVHGLSIADAYLRAGVYRHVLVVAAEVQSPGLDLSNRGRDMAVIFADGAGAAVVGAVPDDDARGILAVRVHSDGEHAEDLWCEAPSVRNWPEVPPSVREAGRHYPRMHGRVVFRHAVQRMPEVVHEVLRAGGHTLDELTLLVPHQANLRILEHVQKTLELPDDKVAVNLDRYGNTTAASIPLAFDECRRSGRLSDGDLVCLVAFGAGFTWGAALLRL